MDTWTLQHKIGYVDKTQRPVSTWRHSPGDLTAACHAAVYYARRDNVNYAVVPGNAYMQRVYRICRADNIYSAVVLHGTYTVAIARPNGDVYQAQANV